MDANTGAIAGPDKKRLGVLLSGRGSNFENIAEHIANCSLGGCEISVVLSNVADAPGLDLARKRGLATVAQPSHGVPREEHDRAMLEHLQAHGAEWVILAGYMRVLTPLFLQTFPQRVLNIHPSLLPSFPGLEAQRQALEYGVKVAGCTVHFVEDTVDGGVIVMQRLVRVRENDTVERLSKRILAQEHRLYPEAIARVLSGRYTIQGRSYLPR